MEADEQNKGERNYASFLSHLADKLMKAQLELDELILQLASGKADARDKFEEAKEQLKHLVSEFKTTNVSTQITGASQKLKELLEELELQLNLGKAESKDKFEEQRKKIEEVITKVHKELKKINQVLNKDHLEHEIEIFKLKLEILRLRFEVKKFEVRDSFKEEMQEAKKKIENTASKLKTKLSSERSVVDKLRREAKGAYKHLRKAIGCI